MTEFKERVGCPTHGYKNTCVDDQGIAYCIHAGCRWDEMLGKTPGAISLSIPENQLHEVASFSTSPLDIQEAVSYYEEHGHFKYFGEASIAHSGALPFEYQWVDDWLRNG